MKYLPFPVIEAAKQNDIEAAERIMKHFEGYIASQCLCHYEDKNGNIHTYVDEDLRYFAETALCAAIFTFQFREPPDDFEI